MKVTSEQDECTITKCWPKVKYDTFGKSRAQECRSSSGSVVSTLGEMSHPLIRKGSQPVYDIGIISRNSPSVSESTRIDRLSISLSI